MAHVEYLFETSRRGLVDSTAGREAFRFRKESDRVAEGHGGSDLIFFQNSNEVVALFDRRDDGEASAQIVDSL
jgi:hypothetical protein